MNDMSVKSDPNIVPSLCSEFTDLKMSRFLRIPIKIIKKLFF